VREVEKEGNREGKRKRVVAKLREMKVKKGTEALFS